MSIENDLKRIADSLEILAAKASGIEAAPPTDAADTKQDTKQDKPAARTRRTKAEMAADAEAAAAKEAKPEVVKATQPDPQVVEAAPFEYDYLKTEVLRLANMGSAGRVATAALMKEFGVAKAIEVPTGRWNELYGRLQTEIAKLEEVDAEFA